MKEQLLKIPKYRPIFTKEYYETEKKCDKLVADYMALPFYRKWGKYERVKQEIISNWAKLSLNQVNE